MSKFSLSTALTGILGGGETAVNFFDLIQSRKILIVNLSKGKIGEDNAKLIGSILVSQLQLAIMRRASLPKHQRDPFMLYVDEFQNFTTSAFQTILSEARKYKLCLTLAHQYITQIDADLRHAIFGNVGTMIVFPLAENDAQPLQHELGQFDAKSVAQLDSRNHEALYRPATSSSETIKFVTLPPPRAEKTFIREIAQYTKDHYSKYAAEEPAAVIEAQPIEIRATMAQDEPQIEKPALPIPPPARAIPDKIPASSPAFTGMSRREQVMHYLTQAGYLTSEQIGDLVFSQAASEGAKRKAVSEATSKLEEQNQLGSVIIDREKVCYTNQKPNLRNLQHELGVRDIFVEVMRANFAIRELKFFNQVSENGNVSPDLYVNFESTDGADIPTFWEYDNATESDDVLLSKLKRYQPYFESHKIIFVFSSSERMQKFFKKLPTPPPPVYLSSAADLRAAGGLGGIKQSVFCFAASEQGNFKQPLFMPQPNGEDKAALAV